MTLKVSTATGTYRS